MPRKYQRKTTRGSTPDDVLKRAAAAVANGESVRSVAKDFNINRMTLKRYMVKQEKFPEEATGYAAVACKQAIFSFHMEKELTQHIVHLADMFHGRSLLKCREVAFQFATRNSVEMPESWKKKARAGKDWWFGFRARHHLSIRSPEAITSFARASAFNRPSVNKFYDNLATIMDRYKFAPSDIYNTDETGCTTVQKPKSVVAETGRKQIGSITSAERGELVTIVYTVSASGIVLPPMFIFPRVNYRDHFIRGAPPGSIGRASRTGWINEDLFQDYLCHVIQQTRCSPEHKILLILDNHQSHISLRAIDLAKSNGIILLTLPPHTSHRLQPLDRSVYGPFKSAFNRALDGWLRSNPGKTATIYEIPVLVNEAHLSAMSPRNIISGFSSTGIWPFNRDLFSEVEFAPAETTDRDVDTNTDKMVAASPNKDHGADDAIYDSASSTSVLVQMTPAQSSPQPGTSGYVSPAALLPLPKAGPRQKSTARKKQTTQILTYTPVRNAIALKSDKGNSKKPTAKPKKSLFGRKQRNRKEDTSSESESTDVEYDSEESDLTEDGCEGEESDSDPDDEEIIEGDFVIVKLAGKSRTVHYIARIDVIDGDNFEGIFLQKLPGRFNSVDRPTIFVPNPNDEAKFPRENIVHKLQQPKILGGSARRSSQLVFECNLCKWNIP